ncbi:MAG: TIGR02710 family CRISPR-associated CARF protein [bacterium]
MKKILILSVGGSSEPIVNAINFYKPDFVYFFCSSGHKGSAITIDGPGEPCGNKSKSKCPECGYEYYIGNPKGKAVVFQVGLSKDKYEIISVDDPDDLNLCYSKLVSLSTSIKKIYPEAQIIANYTGGTKTMSAAMALVGIMTEEWDLSLNKGPRLDIIKIKGGDIPVVINKWQIFAEQCLESAAKTLENYDYALADAIVSGLLSHPLEPSFERRLLRTRQLCVAFDCWDKFEHKKALELLQPCDKDFFAYIIPLKRILKKTKTTGYELVGDLLNNAERRATQQRYDDAIARLYRATELFAQIRIEKTKGYKLGKLTLKELDEELRPEYSKYMKENDRLLLGLREDYELLYKMKDPIGNEFKENESSLLEALKYRNSSILAHGIIPLKEEDYNFVNERLKGFILKAAKKIDLHLESKQLPQGEIIKS